MLPLAPQRHPRQASVTLSRPPAVLQTQGMLEPRFTLEYYQDPDGDEPVRRWIFSGLDGHKRRAIVLALKHILGAQGIDVCRTEYGRHLGQGLFEFRLRHDEAELRRRLRLDVPPVCSETERVLLRVFCHAHGSRIVLLLAAYDKGADPSKKRQQREIATARRRLRDFRSRGTHRRP